MKKPFWSRWKTLVLAAVIAPIMAVIGLNFVTSPMANATTGPSVSTPKFSCPTGSATWGMLDFTITVTKASQVHYVVPGGQSVTFSPNAAMSVPVSEPATLADGSYTLLVTIDGADFSKQFKVACDKTTPPPTSTTPSASTPTCVTLTTANIAHYATLTGNRHTSVTVTLKGKATDYCNNWSFSGVRYNITNPSNIWNPPQVVAQVNTASVGKVGLSATATVSDTSCGQNDFYEGTGPAVGDKLPGSGQGYESNHKFLSTIFGGSPTWYQNVSKCATVTPTPTPTVTPPIPAKFYSRTCTAVVVNLYDTNAGSNNLVVKGFIGETALTGVDSAAPDYSALTTFTGVPQGAFTLKVELWLDGKLNVTYTFQVAAATECSTSTPTPTVTPTTPATTAPATTKSSTSSSTSTVVTVTPKNGDNGFVVEQTTQSPLPLGAVLALLFLAGAAVVLRVKARRA